MTISISEQLPKEYTATSSLQFVDINVTQNALGLATPGAVDPTVFAATNTQLVGEAPVVARAAQLLRLTSAEVRSAVQIASKTGTSLVTVSATSRSPQRAAEIATTYARVFVNGQRRQQRAQVLEARSALSAQLSRTRRADSTATQRADLKQRIADLGILASVQKGGVVLRSVADVPASPSSPNTRRSGLLGFVVGALFGLALAILIERLDQRVRSSDDYEREFSRPLLGTISPIPRRRDPIDDAAAHAGVELLRVNLSYAGLGRSVRTVLVTSAVPDEGKSTIASMLAVSLAESGSSVLLVDGDLRKGRLASRLNVQSSYGLSDVLIGRAAPVDAIVTASAFGDVAQRATETQGRLAFLGAGSAAPNPGDLIESEAMTGLLVWARAEFDLVVIDTPPALAVPDALSLLTRVDGSLVVGRLGVTRRDRMRALARQLRQVQQQPLGLVLFAGSKGDAAYGYGSYGYGAAIKQRRPRWDTGMRVERAVSHSSGPSAKSAAAGPRAT